MKLVNIMEEKTVGRLDVGNRFFVDNREYIKTNFQGGNRGIECVRIDDGVLKNFKCNTTVKVKSKKEKPLRTIRDLGFGDKFLYGGICIKIDEVGKDDTFECMRIDDGKLISINGDIEVEFVEIEEIRYK